MRDEKGVCCGDDSHAVTDEYGIDEQGLCRHGIAVGILAMQ